MEFEESEELIDPRVFSGKLRAIVRDEPKAFAYDLGLSLSAVYNYLNGRVPTTDVLFRIAKYSGQPMEWFLTKEGNSFEIHSEEVRSQAA
ncbi:MAG: helix-turn-helix transcriptional regulator [Deltaproteobacteria bacterium]